jgi:hypothetical protein
MSDLLWIKDSIVNWSLGSKMLKLGLIENGTRNVYEYTTATVDSNGTFSISLNHVAPSKLTPVVQIQNLPVSLISVSNSNVKGALGELLFYDPDSSKPNWMGYCVSKVVGETVGHFTLDYLYLEDKLDVTGTFVGGAQVNGINYSTSFVYDLHYKQGWNKIVVTLTERQESGNNVTEKYSFTNSETSESQWWVFSIGP